MFKYLSALILGVSLAGSVVAQTAWPERPIKLVVGATPGGSNDLVGRALAQALTPVLGQPVIVENKPGVGSSIGADFAAKAPPDGYTMLIASPASISVNPALDVRWASAHNLVPVVKLTSGPLVIAANAQLGVKSVRELIDYAKKNRGKINFAHSGIGTAPHLAGVLFNQLAGTDLEPVAYKGGGDAVMSVLAGDTQATFATPPSVLQHVKSGRLVGLAVTTPDRSSVVPDLPGMKEAGLANYKMDFWCGLFVPPGTPAEIVRKLFDATRKAMQTPEFKATIAAGGMEVPTPASSADFVAFLREDNKFWEKLAKDSGAKLE